MANIQIEINETDIKILESELIDYEDWSKNAVEAKINNIWLRFRDEWTTRLIDDESFTDSIPSNKADFITLITSRDDYKNASEKDEGNTPIE